MDRAEIQIEGAAGLMEAAAWRRTVRLLAAGDEILMGVELVLNAANVNLVAFNRFAHGGPAGFPALDGQVFAIFIIVLAAAEAAVALAIFLNYYNNFSTIDVERAQNLKG